MGRLPMIEPISEPEMDEWNYDQSKKSEKTHCKNHQGHPFFFSEAITGKYRASDQKGHSSAVLFGQKGTAYEKSRQDQPVPGRPPTDGRRSIICDIPENKSQGYQFINNDGMVIPGPEIKKGIRDTEE